MTTLMVIRDTIYALTSCCFPNPIIAVVENVSSRQRFALKKIKCSTGDHKAISDVMHEIDMYRLFDNNENIIKLKDKHIITEKDGTKSIYLFFPYYKRGNLQDNIDSNNINKICFPERDLLVFFLNICFALQELHGHEVNNANIPYAHRDMKPENILISDDGKSPILMDFGSVTKARIPINTRQDGLLQQDIAAEYSTMSYRAPELYDIKTGSVLDEKVDIWSLGCTLFAAAYGQNPFEISANEMGGSMVLSILNGNYKFPSNDLYSEEFKELIKCLLVVEPNERFDIYQTISKIKSMIGDISE
ncbi:hypothetical protein G6F57_008679 [Rhizopus arrhizus]|uniref:non-specific serine/threonine protein kinase n=1 Tax=Rhizopus oryzae TaxID=64495 RepID=A0A9P7BPQ0_RHIOR|nr:hypothetical protein G6F30_009738 [Rhizopus arrhizus]KAG1003336.1 hypothetical protein G6F27_011140 [Rhizopus arrhizus]KAG1035665.1 hypothetical protein G6F25_008643 [Rhizopus arrhizus]KAG1099810.1 hypothetical protein G6F39_004423 [Rhizopus arrhizus]KAG1274660.1 hypothetical protein G6F65_010340 [Rhizopus arrhizus]